MPNTWHQKEANQTVTNRPQNTGVGPLTSEAPRGSIIHGHALFARVVARRSLQNYYTSFHCATPIELNNILLTQVCSYRKAYLAFSYRNATLPNLPIWCFCHRISKCLHKRGFHDAVCERTATSPPQQTAFVTCHQSQFGSNARPGLQAAFTSDTPVLCRQRSVGFFQHVPSHSLPGCCCLCAQSFWYTCGSSTGSAS